MESHGGQDDKLILKSYGLLSGIGRIRLGSTKDYSKLQKRAHKINTLFIGAVQMIFSFLC